MEHEHTIHGLMRKRAEIAGQLQHHQKQVRKLFDALGSIDTSLKLFQPDIELTTIKPKPVQGRFIAKNREMSTIIFAALREKAPQDIQALTKRVMTERFLDLSDKKLVALMKKRVMAACRQHRRRGVMFSVQGAPYLLWDMVE